MYAIRFKEDNKIYAKNQGEYLPLPVYGDENQVIHCWKLPIMERLKLLFKGKFWIIVLNFGNRLQPIKPTVSNPFRIKK